MHEIETVIGLLAAVVLLAAAASRVGLPYPVVLVVGGLALGWIPGLPTPDLDPRLVFLVFLPPLVYAAAFRVARLELRANALNILVLAVGLVLVTLLAVASVAREAAGLPWVSAFALGALVAATDPVSATATIRRLGAPERIVAILEGEALVNDGTGLAAFQVAVAAAASGFSLGHGVARFVEISAGGLVVGLATGLASGMIRRFLDEPVLEIPIGLLTAFGSYIAADELGFSGVLAAVAAGLYVGRGVERMTSPAGRLQSEPFWEALTFMLESLLFLLIGLQVPHILDALPSSGAWQPLGQGAAVTAAVVAIRFAWMFTVTPAVQVIDPWKTTGRRRLPRRELAVLGWSGMRGALSLAGALSIPLSVSGHPFPGRDVVIFLSYFVVLATLIVPGLTLAPMMRAFGMVQSHQRRREELQARKRITLAALTRLDRLAEDVSAEALAPLRALYESRLGRLQTLERHELHDGAGGHPEPAGQVRWEMIDAQREALAEMRDERKLAREVLQEIQREIDVEEARLRGLSPPSPLATPDGGR